MSYVTRVPRPLVIPATIIFCSCIFGLVSLSQLSAQEKSKHGDFGSSLRRLKWDPQKNATVESVDQGEKHKDVVQGDDVVRIETTLVACDVLVLDEQGRSVQGLTQNDFAISDDGQPQQISTFALGNDRKLPRSIVLIIDYSGSQFPYLSASVAAAKTLVDQLQPTDRMAIVTDDVSLLVDFTQDKKKLKKALESLKEDAMSGASGRSRQYSALMATLKELVSAQERTIIIFQTDGDELPSLQPVPSYLPPEVKARSREFSLVDVINAAERARVTIYTVIPNLRLVGLPPDVQLARTRATFENGLEAGSQRQNQKSQPMNLPVEWFNRYAVKLLKEQTALEGLAKLSGGWTEFLEKPEEAAQIYARILSDVNHRYILGFQPTDKHQDDKRHKVGIEVRGHPKYVVLGVSI